jgi:type VI secretion system protein ImpH
VTEPPVFRRLYQEPFAFDFFQAVRLLARMPDALARTEPGKPPPEVARFAAHLSLAFPASAVHDLESRAGALPVMTVTFLGLFGPNGVLPHHYTQRLINREHKEGRPKAWVEWDEGRKDRWRAEARALRDWLDLFNHRFVHLFYRAWEKYRFWLAHERGETDLREPDRFTLALLALVGQATPWQRGRLVVAAPVAGESAPAELAAVRDRGLLRYAGLLAQRHRNAWGLRALLAGYFERPVAVEQFQGQWLPLEEASQSRVGDEDGNCALGESTVVGDRVWDVQGKVRIRLGPLTYQEFAEYLPDRAPVEGRKAFFLLSHVARLYLGPEFDFDVQLVLRKEDVPSCRLTDDRVAGPRLGWNCWVLSQTPEKDAEDAVFEGDTSTIVGVNPRRSR